MRSDIVPGATFPDYALPDHTEHGPQLSELQGDDPMILTLARGHYCPKEHQQHLELAAFQPKIAVAYTQIVTIATDEHHTLQEFRASVGAQWPFLSDPGRIDPAGPGHPGVHRPRARPDDPAHARAQAGTGRAQHLQRLLVLGSAVGDDLWRDLRAASSEIRPDWDLSRPGLREAWDAGDYSSFHGWDPAGPARRPRRGELTMPWFPDFVSAVELARGQTRAAGQADPVGAVLHRTERG